MKKQFCFLAVFLVAARVSGQTYDKKAFEYYRDGIGRYFAKDFIAALADFTKAIKLDSSFIQAWENRGVTKFYLEDYAGALLDYNQALKINPDDYKTYGRRAWAKFNMEDLRGAIDDFSKAIEGNVNAADYHIGRGKAKFKLKDYKGAMADFNKVVRFLYGDRNQRKEAFFWRGITKIDLGQRQSGCLDLSKSRKMGYDKAYEVYEVYCK
jgi:tetratricopeptide (TPR) repeat protein